MHAWEQIQKAVDYIEDHLSEEISVEALAERAALSPFYFQRLFSRLVRKPPAEYIRLRRMARAAGVLLEPDKRILDAALDLGFSSHGHFSRTFKETFGLTPEEYRKKPVALNTMTKPQLLLHYTLVDENVPLITDGITLEISRRRLEEPERFLGFTAETPVALVPGLGVESGADPLDSLWRRFHDAKGGIPGLVPGGEELGAAHPGAREGTFRYFAGGRAHAEGGAAGCDVWELPAGEYIVCTFEAESFQCLVMDALYKAQQYLFGTWLPGHGLATRPFSAERYQSHGPGTTKMELWVMPIPL